jgi:hypothetical protein
MADQVTVLDEGVAVSADAKPDAKPEVKEEFVPKADFDKVLAEMGTLKGALTDAGQKLQMLDKVAAALTGKPGATRSKDEQVVVDELYRLLPQLKYLDQAPDLIKQVQAAQAGAAEGLVQAAYGYQLELQQEAGIKVDDPKTNFYVGTAIKEWINQDNTRRARFWRGDRTVVKEGFDEVSAALLSPTRVTAKRATMETVNGRPKSGAPAGGAGGGTSEGPTVNFQDPKSVRAAFKAALAG